MSGKKPFFSRNSSMDLTEGPIFSKVLVFALPLLAGQLFQTLYNSVDSIVIGNFETPEALAAVTASGVISMIIAGFFTGMSAGASGTLSRLFGAKEYGLFHDAIHTTVLASFVFGIVLAACGVILSPALLDITGCPDDIRSMAIDYLRIYLIGVFFTCIYNICSAVLRSIGDSTSPFIFLVISSVLNIVLDLLFVGAFKMGVVGVALATIISQFVSMVLSFIKMMQMDEQYRFRFRDLMIDWKLLGEVAKLGLPAGLQSSLQSIGALVVQSYTNSFSFHAIAGIGSGMRIDQFAGMACNSLGLAMTTFIGQNIGAKKYGRTHMSVGASVIIASVYIIIVSIPAYFFAEPLVGIFSPDPEVIMYGSGFLRTIMPLYLFMGLNQLFNGILRGYGYSLTSMICSLTSFIGIRQLWLYVTLNYVAHDVRYLYWCYPLTWFTSLLSLVLVYLIRIRKKYPPEKSDTTAS